MSQPLGQAPDVKFLWFIEENFFYNLDHINVGYIMETLLFLKRFPNKMSSIKFSLEKLDRAVSKLDASVTNVESALQDFVPQQGNVVDVDFVAKRLDNAIETVESILQDEV